jgi:MraZ protein
VFLGQYNHTIDDKGRLAVPMKFREALARGAVVTRGLDSSLFLLPVEEWGKFAATIAHLPLGQSNARAFARLMLAGAMDVALDKQGRCVIPEYLRQYAELKKEVVLVGMNTRVEIWDANVWAAYVAKTEDDAEEIAEKLGEFGL